MCAWVYARVRCSVSMYFCVPESLQWHRGPISGVDYVSELCSSGREPNHTVRRGEGVRVLTAWSHTNYTRSKHINSLYLYCISCHHSGVCEWQLWYLSGAESCECVCLYDCMCLYEGERQRRKVKMEEEQMNSTSQQITFICKMFLSKATFSKCSRAERSWFID